MTPMVIDTTAQLAPVMWGMVVTLISSAVSLAFCRRPRTPLRFGVVVLAALAGLPFAARGQESDPVRCEALRLKKESAYYDCLSRCDRRAARRERVDAAECDTRCDEALAAALDRVELRAPCQPPEPEPVPEPEAEPEPKPEEERVTPADPELCEAQVLRVEARRMFCQARCEARGRRNGEFDVDSCETRCDGRARTATEAVLGKPVCGLGRASTAE